MGPSVFLIKAIDSTSLAKKPPLTILYSLYLASIVWTGEGYGSFWSGRELLTPCYSKSPPRKVQCHAHLAGAIDASKPVIVTPYSVNLFCTSADINIERLRQIILSYLRTNSEKLHYSASALAILDLRKEFPCN